MAGSAEQRYFWGEIDSLHIFCEPKYATSPYVAEFYNSISSLAYCAAGLYLFAQPAVRADGIVTALALALTTIGAGSTAFHGTMRYAYELWDELPMVAFMTCALYAKADCLPSWLAMHRLAFIAIVTAWALGLAIAYVYLRLYEVFIGGFTVLVTADLLFALAQRSEHRSIRTLRLACIVLTVVGKLVWEIEDRTCAMEPRVWVLHVAWHGFSCVAAYLGVIANLAYRVETAVSPSARSQPALSFDWPLFHARVKVMGRRASDTVKARNSH